MSPTRVLLIGDSISLLRRIFDALEESGFSVTVGAGGPPPSVTLARSMPDTLIIELGPGLGRLDRWRQAIESYRNRKALSILTISNSSQNRLGVHPLLPVSNLGTLSRPIDLDELLNRLQEGSETDAHNRKAA